MSRPFITNSSMHDIITMQEDMRDTLDSLPLDSTDADAANGLWFDRVRSYTPRDGMRGFAESFSNFCSVDGVV